MLRGFPSLYSLYIQKVTVGDSHGGPTCRPLQFGQDHPMSLTCKANVLSWDNLCTQDLILLRPISNRISEQLPSYLSAQSGKGCHCSWTWGWEAAPSFKLKSRRWKSSPKETLLSRGSPLLSRLLITWEYRVVISLQGIQPTEIELWV